MSAPDVRSDGVMLPINRLQFTLAVLGHILLGAFLAFGVRCSKLPEEAVIQAVLLEDPVIGEKPVTVEEAAKPKPPEPKPPPPKPEPPKPTPPPPPQPPKVDPEQQRREAAAAEQKRQSEAIKREQEQLLAKQQAEAKVLQAAEKARIEADAKAKRDAEEVARKAAEEEARRVALEQEQKRLAAIEDAKRREAEAIENQRKAEERARQEALARQIAAEEAARMAAIRADATKLWGAAIREALRRNWLRPPGGADDFRCKLSVKLAPNGTVVSARITSSCGSQQLDDSVLKAVYKTSPFPLPNEPSAFVSDLNLGFTPR